MEIEDALSHTYQGIATRKSTVTDYWSVLPSFLEKLDRIGFDYNSDSRREPAFSMSILSQLREAETYYGLWVFTVRDEDTFKLIAKKKRFVK